jgi:methyl coenzyme M reductase subunit C-like uncharacterized protein (methanogenesis marker protein 7)
MIQKIEYQGDGVFENKPVMVLSEDIGGLTLIGHFVKTELIQKIEEDKDAS